MTKLYAELADWWPLFSGPAEYAEEAAVAHEMLKDALGGTGGPRKPTSLRPTLLELGSGGGNNALYLKAHYAMTLTDLSPQMVAVSRALNPELEHHIGDMRTLRLGRRFDAVFVHDAVEYMTREDDLAQAIATVWEHLRPGGAALIAPDCVRETFTAGADMGGGDGDGRSIRWLEWTTDPDPADSAYTVDYVLVLKDRDGTRVVHDVHECGVFPRDTWITLLRRQGFHARSVPDPWRQDVFVAKRPGP